MRGRHHTAAKGYARARFVAVVLAAAGLPGCMASQEAPESSQEGAELANAEGLRVSRTDRALSGNLRTPAGEVSFVSQLVSDLRVDLSMTINGKAFSWTKDEALEVQTITGHDAILDARDHDLLKDLIVELEPYLTELPERAPQDMFPFMAASYWEEAPDGYVHRARTIGGEGVARPKSIGSDAAAPSSYVCLAAGTTWTLPYTRSNGTVECSTATVNTNWKQSACNAADYSCMGRCGGGCGGFGGGLTMDCLEHDICSHNLCASGGGSDVNCGDEYDQAADDFSNFTFGGSCTPSNVTPGMDPVCVNKVVAACGNGVIEAGEACDNTSTCCTWNCGLASNGTTCTGGTCDAGTCAPTVAGASIHQTALSGASSAQLFFELLVPAGGTAVQFVLSGGTGNADLYVRKNTQVSSSSYDCRPYLANNAETCAGSGAGRYYVMVRGRTAFAGVSLHATYTQGVVVTPLTQTLSGASSSEQRFTLVVPAGGADVIVATSAAASGNADLYIKKGTTVTTSSYDCRSNKSGTLAESCAGTGAGTYTVLVRGYSAFTGVTLTGSYTSL